MEESKTKFDCWALVELMGHQRIVGKVSEQPLFGVNMCRVDVPATKAQPAFTKYYGGSAIYSTTPITEEMALSMVENIGAAPVTAYEVREFISKQEAIREEKELKKLAAGPDQEEKAPWDDNDDVFVPGLVIS
jgi:hypothetical protein